MKIKNKKRISIMLVVMIILNLFLPYTMLKKSYAVSSVAPMPTFVMKRTSEILTHATNGKYFTADIAIVGDVHVTTFDFKIGFDKTKLELGNKTTKAATTALNLATDANPDIYINTNYAVNTSYYNVAEGSFRYVGAATQKINPMTDWETYGFEQGVMRVYTLTFRVIDPAITSADQLTADMFYFMPNGVLLTGFKMGYADELDNRYFPTDTNYFQFQNFATAAAEPTGIDITTQPTKTTYNHGENIDLTGGKITVTYDDASTAEIDLTDPEVTITGGNPVAVGNNTVTISYKGFTDTFNITVNDPVNSIALTTMPTKTTYLQDEAIDLTGGVLTVTTLSGATSTINLPNAGVTADATGADLLSPNIVGALGTNANHLPTGTQKITLTHDGKQTDYNITVNDVVESLSVSGEKTQMKYNQFLDLSQGTVTPTLKSGITTVSANLSEGTKVSVTGYSRTTLGNQTLNVSAFGSNTTYQLEVVDYIVGIQVNPPTKVLYQFNEDLDITGISGVTTMASGQPGTPITITAGMVTGYNKMLLGLQDIYVTYGTTNTIDDTSKNFTDSFEITLEDYITSITITAPTKSTYNHGDVLDLTGGIVRENYASGATVNVPMTTGMITEQNDSPVVMNPGSYDGTNKLEKTLKITYGGTTQNYPITIINDVKSIVMKNTPKTVYNVNESLDVTGGVITVTRAVGTSDVSLTSGMITGFTTATEATNRQLTVSYLENGITKTTTYGIDVIDSVTGFVIKTVPQTDYKFGESLDLAGGVITVTRGSGDSDIAITSGMISGYNPNMLGLQTVTITYAGFTKTFDVTVYDYITGITVTSPTNLNYKYNQDLNLAGGLVNTVTASGAAGTSVAITSGMVSGYNKTTIGNQTLTVTYTTSNTIDNSSMDFTGTFGVNVQDYVVGINVTSPTKTVYQYGELLDLTGASGLETMASGADGNSVVITSGMVSGFNSNTLGNQTLTVTYTTTNTINGLSSDFTDTFDVTVEDYVANIVITEPTKSVYNHGETIDLAGGTIVETMASGAINNVTMTLGMITELNDSPVVMNPGSYDGTNKLDKTLKITHGGTTQNYPITIINDVKSIAVTTLPKTDYNVNDLLDVTSGEITITRAVGTSTETLTSGMITGFDTSVEATNMPLTVSYTENGITQTTNYNINVVDSITGFTITTTPKISYQYGESLEVTGGKITVTRGSGDTIIDLTSEMVSGYNPNTLGNQTVTVTYGGFTQNYEVTVSDFVVGITVTSPSKLIYQYGELLDLTGATLVENYASGLVGTEVTVTSGMMSGYNENTLGSQTLTVTYSGFTDTFDVTVEDYVANIAITEPTKSVYNHGETIDLTGGTIVETMASGAINNVTMTLGMITELNDSPVVMNPGSYDGTNKLDKTLKITHGGTTQNYPITIINDVKSIAVTTLPKTDYNVNDLLDVTSGQITITRAVGTSVETLTDVMVTSFDSSVEGTNMPLTVTYTENGITQTTTYNVNITDLITGFTITTTPKTAYQYGETLDVNGGKLTVQRGSGDTEIALTSGMVSGYNSNVLGNQTLTVTYGGYTQTYDITVSDYVTGITVTSPSKLTYQYGELLDLTGATLVENYASGLVGTEVTVTSGMMSGYNENTLGSQTLTVTYSGFTDTFDVTVEDYVANISITEPTKSVYNHGENIDLTGGTIVETMASGAVNNITMTDEMITEQDDSSVVMNPGSYDTTNKLDKTLKITYGGTNQNYPITIINDVKSIEVTTLPKTEYNVNDLLDVTNGEITITRATGSSTETLTTGMISGFDSSVEVSNMPLTVTYIENGITQTTTYNINVIDSAKGFIISTNAKTDYLYGEELDVTGGKLTVQMGSGDTIIDITSDMVSGYDSNTLGSQTLTVTYGGYTQTYDITVSDYVTGITVTSPSKLTYQYGELLDLTGATLVENYASGLVGTEVTVTSGMMSGYNENTLGSQTLTVTYSGFTDTFDVTVEDYVANISITEPTKSVYNHGENLDLTGGIIVETMASGATNNIIMTSEMITELNDSPVVMNPLESDYDLVTKQVNKTLKITYGGTMQNYPITIINDIKNIEVTAVPKTNYNVNDEIDLTDGQITITRAIGTSVMSISESMVSGFDTSAEVTNMPLTVTYTENGITQTTTYNINVGDLITDFTITNMPKTVYQYGETLDVTGGQLTVTRGSGPAVINMTEMMVSGFNPNTLGSQTLTVTYGGLTRTYDVTVSDYVTDIIVTGLTKTIYEYGEDLDLTEATVKSVMASGTSVDSVPITIDMISGYNKNSVGTQTVTITYEGITKQVNITVEDNIESIVMLSNPTKTTYKYGEQIDLTGARITKTTTSGATETINVLNSMVTGYSETTLGIQSITVSYTENGITKTTSFNVLVEDYVQDIVISDVKTAYIVNEELDLTDAKVSTIMASGLAGTEVPITPDMITEFDTSAEGAKEVSVTYEGITKNFSITVSDPITGITIQVPTKTVYLYEEDLDLTGATVTVNKASGATVGPINITEAMVNGYDSKVLGVQTLTVSYLGQTNTFNVNVQDWDKELRITTIPKTNYEYGESLNVENGKVAIYTASGVISATMPEGQPVDITAGMVTGFSSTQEGTQTLTVTWNGFSKTYNINLVDSIIGILMNSNPNNTEVKYGEELDLTGATIKVQKTSGEYIIVVTDSMLSGYDKNKSGEQSITVNYEGKTTNFIVKVGEKPIDETVVLPVVTPIVPNRPVTPIENIEVVEPIEETEKVVEPEELKPEENKSNESKPEEKPTITLGEKDKNIITKEEIVLISIAGFSIIIALGLLIGLSRKNTEIYVIEDGKVRYKGKGKLDIEKAYIDISKYITKNEENIIIRLILKEKTAEKLNTQEINVRINERVIVSKITNDNNKYIVNVQ